MRQHGRPLGLFAVLAAPFLNHVADGVRDVTPVLASEGGRGPAATATPGLGAAAGGLLEVAGSSGRILQGVNASAADCDASKYSVADTFSASVPIPMYGVIILNTQLMVIFKRNEANCFSFTVRGTVGVKIFIFSAYFSVTYSLSQKLKDGKTECSHGVPTPKVILSYLAGRVLQYAKGQSSSGLEDTGSVVMQRYNTVKAAWDASSGSKKPRLSVEMLADSLAWFYAQVKAKYVPLRTARTPTGMPEAVNMALEAFRQARVYPGGPAEVQTCLDLHAEAEETEKWMWCYFTSLYPFEKDSYHDLVRDTCFGGGRDMDVWKNMKDTTLGINVQANPELCADDDGDCMVTLPREFMILFPCYSWSVVNFMVLSDSDYSGGAAMELVMDANDKQFGFTHGKTALDLHDRYQEVQYAQIIGRTVKARADAAAKTSMARSFRKGFSSLTGRTSTSDDLKLYGRYLQQYATLFEGLVSPGGAPGDGFASDVDTDDEAFFIKEKLTMALGAKGTLVKDQGLSLDLQVQQVINLVTWRSTQSCVVAKVIVPLSDAWSVTIKPSLCYSYGSDSALETKLPVTLAHYTPVPCVTSPMGTGSPTAYVCNNPDYETLNLVQQVMQSLKAAGIRIYAAVVGGSPSRKNEKSVLTAIGDALMSAIQAVTSHLAHSTLLGLTQTSVNMLLKGVMTALPASVTCSQIVQQTIDLLEEMEAAKAEAGKAEAEDKEEDEAEDEEEDEEDEDANGQIGEPEIGWTKKIKVSFGAGPAGQIQVSANQKILAAVK